MGMPATAMHALMDHVALRRQPMLGPLPLHVDERTLALAKEQVLQAGERQQIVLGVHAHLLAGDLAGLGRPRGGRHPDSWMQGTFKLFQSTLPRGGRPLPPRRGKNLRVSTHAPRAGGAPHSAYSL